LPSAHAARTTGAGGKVLPRQSRIEARRPSPAGSSFIAFQNRRADVPCGLCPRRMACWRDRTISSRLLPSCAAIPEGMALKCKGDRRNTDPSNRELVPHGLLPRVWVPKGFFLVFFFTDGRRKGDHHACRQDTSVHYSNNHCVPLFLRRPWPTDKHTNAGNSNALSAEPLPYFMVPNFFSTSR
jgi:hypothetical protein